jgi:hypothetical protein
VKPYPDFERSEGQYRGKSTVFQRYDPVETDPLRRDSGYYSCYKNKFTIAIIRRTPNSLKEKGEDIVRAISNGG